MDIPKVQLIRALKVLCEREGGTRAVADKAEVNDQTLYQIIKGIKLDSGEPRGVGPRLQAKLEKAFPGWATLGRDEASKSGAFQAHVMSGTGPNIRPATVDSVAWRELKMAKAGNIVYGEVGEHSLSDYRVGTILRFEFGAVPEHGNVVLIKDRAGEIHLRIYGQSTDGPWVGISDRAGFRTLTPAEGDVVAVKTGQILEGR